MTLSSLAMNNDKYISPFGSKALQKYALLPVQSKNELKNDCFIKRHKAKNNSSIIQNIIVTGLAAAGLFLYKKNIANAISKTITNIKKLVP